MKITAYPLHDHPVNIEPSPSRRALPGEGADFFDDPSVQAATSRGWDLLCPYRFEARWNGGPDPADIEISAPGFAVSRVGHGVLTFETGYEFALDPGHHLWVRGPINALKDGIQPLDQVVESDLLPFVGEIHWRFTRPNQTVRFARGEPFGTLLPYPAGYIEQFEGEVADGPAPDLPAVSCLCPTYARPELLEEAIYAFLNQDYRGPKELIVLNDYPGQTLEFDHPEVLIVNLPRRFRSFGEKLNAAAGLAAHDLLFLWSDDDISLPHRLSLSVARLDPARGCFKAARAFHWDNGAIAELARNVFHVGACYTRELFTAVRGYPHASVAADQHFEGLLLRERFEAVAPAERPRPKPTSSTAGAAPAATTSARSARATPVPTPTTPPSPAGWTRRRGRAGSGRARSGFSPPGVRTTPRWRATSWRRCRPRWRAPRPPRLLLPPRRRRSSCPRSRSPRCPGRSPRARPTPCSAAAPH